MLATNKFGDYPRMQQKSDRETLPINHVYGLESGCPKIIDVDVDV